jgi:hypothetical protein
MHRAEYEIDELGDSEFTINGVKYRRDDFQVRNLIFEYLNQKNSNTNSFNRKITITTPLNILIVFLLHK